MPRRTAQLFRLAAAFAAWACCALAIAAEVLVVLGGDGESYREVADAAAEELGRTAPQPTATRIVSARELPRGLAEARAIIAVGTLAAQAVAAQRPGVPVVNALLPQAAFERIVRRHGMEEARFSAVLLDQPVARYLDLLRSAFPERSRFAVLLGPDSAVELAAITQAAASRRLQLVAATVHTEKEIHASLQELLGNADVLLALPDSLVFNSNTLPHILLTAYHARVPVIGFSPAYVTAGATLAVFSTPRQIGRQAGELARHAVAGEALPPPQRPREFSLGVNAHVARSLGIVLDGAEQLQERMPRGGGRR